MCLFFWTQRKIFCRMLETEQFWGTIDLYLFSLLWKSMMPQNSLVTNFLQNIFLCVRRNKDIHTGLELLWGWVNDNRIFIFGWTTPLRSFERWVSIVTELVREKNSEDVTRSNDWDWLHQTNAVWALHQLLLCEKATVKMSHDIHNLTEGMWGTIYRWDQNQAFWQSD